MSETRVMLTVSSVDSLRLDGPRDLGGEPHWAVHDEYRSISVWINRDQLRELAHDLWMAEAEQMCAERDAAAAEPEPEAAPAPADDPEDRSDGRGCRDCGHQASWHAPRGGAIGNYCGADGCLCKRRFPLTVTAGIAERISDDDGVVVL